MRFKTREEFKKQYGKDWHQKGATWATGMNPLFGKKVTPAVAKKVRDLHPNEHEYDSFQYKTWQVNRYMFVDDDRSPELLAANLKKLYKEYGKEEVAFKVLQDLHKGK